ncbi:hypothetical protein E2C01_057148 [Portunus trituberculatus]|uniref:Uncharacterized protein n=1 Tax=Portunus trituberculatus TaxID=210409 RepID=A0A5B7GZL0_PORTR|nr:hypothetical protein [Portunus trituberculatus]
MYDTSGSSLASGRLVSPVAGPARGQSLGSSHVAVSPSTTSPSPLPRFSGKAPSSCVVTLQRLFRARGFSCKAAKFMSRPSGIDLSTYPDLSSLFRSFVVFCPSHLPRLPAWDLSLILRSLLRPPYEPLRSASLRNVSLKTMFLLALTSARRVSGLHGLSAEVRHSKGWTSMTFSFAPNFLAKSSCTGQHSFDEFTIPALLDFVGED